MVLDCLFGDLLGGPCSRSILKGVAKKEFCQQRHERKAKLAEHRLVKSRKAELSLSIFCGSLEARKVTARERSLLGMERLLTK